MRIKTLPMVVANQIAAGEVIENPASVVKELLENALDAHASKVTIELSFGGLNHIKISDNGDGILAEDLPLAIAPHATSKLSTLNELSTLTSMGFRGEALASIASISRVTISSKPAAQANAMCLQTDANSTPHLSPCARNQGTTIDVRDLFYNAPVRRRFLKSERSEYLAIENVVKRIALSAPHLALTLKHNGNLMLDLVAATCEKTQLMRIQKLFGKPFIDNSIALTVDHAGMHLSGFISKPSYQRSQNDRQWIYLNHRMVKDKLILHAIKQAYADTLYPGRYPSCLLYVSLATTEVDINVHPTKHEVRFQQPRLVHDFIESHLHQALSTVITPDVETEPMKSKSDSAIATHPSVTPGFDDHAPLPHPMILREPWRPQPQTHRAAPPRKPTPPWLTLNPHFGLINWQDQHYLIDRQRAQSAQLFATLQQLTQPLAKRPLLVPYRENITPPQHTHLAAFISPLSKFGIDLNLGDNHCIIQSLPVDLPQLPLKTFLHRLLQPSQTPATLPSLLIDCYLEDNTHLTPAEEAALLDFITQALEQHATDPSWCLLLDSHRCQELMRV
jgi:DNA mismatch repair protein MutL